MNRQGYVNRIIEDNVEVSLMRHSACSQCGGCAIGRAESKAEVILAINKANAVAGDYVELYLPDSNVATAALIAYGIPLIAMMAGMVIGGQLGFNDGGALIFGLAGLAGSYLLNKFILEPKRLDKIKYQVIAEKIISEENIEGVF